MLEKDSGGFGLVALTASLFGAGGVPLLITLLLTSFQVSRYTSSPMKFRQDLFWIFLFTAIPGVVLSAIGGFWLRTIGRKSTNVLRLIGYGLLVGSILAVPFVVFAIAVDPTKTPIGVKEIAFCLLAGALSGASYAALFHSVLLGRSSAQPN